ncbi:MAG: DOMON-like domain-containing protein [Synechococcus sp.]
MARHSTLVCQVCRLQPFPSDTLPAVVISGELMWRADGPLTLSYGLLPVAPSDDGMLTDHLIGPWDRSPALGVRRDQLWEHTCFEAFFALPGQDAYWELNVSPSGDWNLYRFSGYRQGRQPEPSVAAPSVSLHHHARGLRCTIALDSRGFWPSAQVPEIALTTVIQHSGGSLSYWALSHPGHQADFHDRRGFLVL